MNKKRSLNNSKYMNKIEDLESYFRNNDSWIPIINEKIIDENDYMKNINQWLESIVSTIESITCSYENKTTTLIVPPDIKSSIKSIITYKYSGNKHYSFNISSTELFDKDSKFIIHFPMITLLDQENNIINEDSIKDKNIQKCYINIIDWLKSELTNFGIPIDIILDEIKNNSIEYIEKINKDNIIDKLKMNNANVIVLDKKSSEDIGLNDLIQSISNAISEVSSNIDISDLTLDNSEIKEKDLLNKNSIIKKDLNNRRNEVILKNVEFENSIQYSEYIEEKLNPYIDSTIIQFCMNYDHMKEISKLFQNFGDMSETEYYNKDNIYNDISFNDFFQGDSFIININYKDILLDSMLVWYSQDDKFYIGRIFDKINYSIPRTKDWYRSCCKYNIQNGLNLNFCSYTGIANIDLTGLCKYVFDDKFNRHVFIDSVKISPGKRCKDHRVFEISSYIWSTISAIFMKKYIIEKRYTGEEQYDEIEYIKSYRSYKMGDVLDGLCDIIKNKYIDKVTISSSKYMIESYINNISIFKENSDIDDLDNNSFINITIPNGDKLYCYDALCSNDVSTADYYIIKSRKKELNKIYDSKENSNKFSIIADKYIENDKILRLNPQSDFIRYNILLIQNIQNINNFLKEILKVFAYLEYDFDNIIDPFYK